MRLFNCIDFPRYVHIIIYVCSEVNCILWLIDRCYKFKLNIIWCVILLEYIRNFARFIIGNRRSITILFMYEIHYQLSLSHVLLINLIRDDTSINVGKYLNQHSWLSITHEMHTFTLNVCKSRWVNYCHNVQENPDFYECVWQMGKDEFGALRVSPLINIWIKKFPPSLLPIGRNIIHISTVFVK